jgi:tRNA(Ile)-lysidine synthase
LSQLPTQVADCLRRHGLASTAGIVAVSGGPDSVALAHACAGLLQAGVISRLVLAHVNHQLRGEESDGDEGFVQDLLAAWHVDDARLMCRTTRIPMAEIARAEHDNLESTARRERYSWLTQVANEESAAWVATGHTADDQAETVLFRLLRGSGVLGLGGMTECRPLDGNVKLLRPLLSVRRQAVIDYLGEKQIAYRVDSSNRDLRFTRNRLRLELLPLLQEHYNPGIVAVLCGLAEQARELHAEIAAEADRLLREAELPRAGNILVFAADRLQSASANQVREMFRLVWQREDWPMGGMDFERWNRLAEIAAGAAPACDFPGRVHARRVGKVMQLVVAGAYN